MLNQPCSFLVFLTINVHPTEISSADTYKEQQDKEDIYCFIKTIENSLYTMCSASDMCDQCRSDIPAHLCVFFLSLWIVHCINSSFSLVHFLAGVITLNIQRRVKEKE
jgi:hypothetical protein